MPLHRWVAILGVLSLASRAAAQSAQKDETICLGFSFSAWNPPLDWRAAGYRIRPDSTAFPRAPGGRDWASKLPANATDSILVLFPTWWPVGVSIELSNRAPAPGDTTTGIATAFTAGGDTKSPVSRVRAWRVPCVGATPGD